MVREDFLLGVPASGIYEEVFNSDSAEFGGSGVVNTGNLRSTGMSWNYLPDSVKLRVPPLVMTVLRLKRKRSNTRAGGKK